MKPTVSIIIPNYNCAPYLRIAVASALAQTYQSLEVVLVDDGSTDDSLTTIMDLVAAERLRLVRQPNQGVAAARSAGLHASTGDYLIFLDADDRLDPQMVERLITLVDPADPYVFAYCDFLRVNVDGDLLPDQQAIHEVRTAREGNLLASLLLGDFLLPLCVLISRHLVIDVGGFDLRYDPVDDYDMWLKVSCVGGQARYLDQALAFYRHRPGSLSTNRVHMETTERSVLHACTERYPAQVAQAVPALIQEFRSVAATIWSEGVRCREESEQQAQAHAEALQASLDQRETYVDALQAALGERERQLHDAEHYAHSLQAALDERETYLRDLQATLERRETQFQQAEHYARSLQAALDERETQFQQAEHYARSLRAALEQREAGFREAEQYAQALRAALDERETMTNCAECVAEK
jgi:GT2 family glycosyltransferase